MPDPDLTDGWVFTAEAVVTRADGTTTTSEED